MTAVARFRRQPLPAEPASGIVAVAERAEPQSEKQMAAAQSLLDFVAPKLAPKKSRAFRLSGGAQQKARAEFEEMAEAGDWSNARGVHLVALYEKLHTIVYGIGPSELDPKIWAVASTLATRMIERDFQKDAAKAVLFMRWAWKREEQREKWRRENGRDGGHIGWRYQFGGALVTEYRLAQARCPGALNR